MSMSDNQFISKIPSVFRKNTKKTFSNNDETINFISKKNPRQVLSESFVNSPLQPLETPMNSTARSVNSTMSLSSGPTTERRNVTPKYLLRSKLAGSAFTKFNAGVTPAQMDPFKNSNFKISQDPRDTNKHGEFLQINDTLEKEIIESTVRRRPYIKTVAHNVTHQPFGNEKEHVKTPSESGVSEVISLRYISRFMAGILTIVLYSFFIYIIYLLFKLL